METIIARQPIFNEHQRLYAYELLYRGTEDLSLAVVGGDRATSAVLTSSYLTDGLEKISNNKPCFINFTEELLREGVAINFPRNKMVVEILEDVRPETDIVEACKDLKEKGYVLALDDFVYDRQLTPLIELADIIKFDFRLTPIDKIQRAMYKMSQYDIEFLAEKVETMEEFQLAAKLGFRYFQGYFFARPETIKIKELSSSQFNLLNLLVEINKKDVSTEKMTTIISSDVALSYKLLRYINSAYFYLVSEVASINHAVAYLGEDEIRRFVTLVALSKIAATKPGELIKMAAIRAKFCEQLGTASPLAINPQELFMLGLFSLLDAMLDTPLEETLKKIPLSDETRSALLHRKGNISAFLDAVIAYEKQDRDACAAALRKARVPLKQVYPLYLRSIKYADTLMGL